MPTHCPVRSHHGCTHFRLREGNTGTVEAIDVLRGEDVVRLRLTSGVVCIVKVDDLDDVSAEERDAIRHFTSSVVHKADNDGGGVDEVSSTSEEDSDGGDPDFEGEDPDSEGEKPTSRKRAAAAGDGPRKRGDGQREREGPRAIILDDAGFPLWPGGLRKQLRDCNAAEAKAYHEAIAKRDAAADAAGADELKAAVSAFDTSPLAEKDNYVAIVGDVKDWAKRGGVKATAAKWIRCLVSKGTDRLAPGRVRWKYKRTWPGAAKVESE